MEIRPDPFGRYGQGLPNAPGSAPAGKPGAGSPGGLARSGDLKDPNTFYENAVRAVSDRNDDEDRRRRGALIAALDDAGRLFAARPTLDTLHAYKLAVQQVLALAVSGAYEGFTFKGRKRDGDATELRIVDQINDELASLAAYVHQNENERLAGMNVEESLRRIKGLLVDRLVG